MELNNRKEKNCRFCVRGESMQQTNKNEIATQKKHNYKLSEEDKHNIILEYYLNRSKCNMEKIASNYDITRQTVHTIVNQYTQKEKNQIIDNCIKEYKQNFTRKSHAIINKALEKINSQLEDQENIDINKLSTTIGILYDKTRLEDNLSTSNNSININIKID